MLPLSAKKKYFLSPETYFYACVSDISKCEHPANKLFLSLETYLYACFQMYEIFLTLNLFTFTNIKF